MGSALILKRTKIAVSAAQLLFLRPL